MCALQRHFLGWDKSLCRLVCDFLLQDKHTSPVDFSDKLIIVPTRHAGQLLKEALVARCAEHNTALLGAEIVTPSYLFTEPADPHEANRTGIIAIIADIFISKKNKYPNLVSSTLSNVTPEWALRSAVRIAELRDELCNGGYLIRDVVKKCASELDEPERWHDLAQLEKELLEQLARLGLKDPCECKIQRTNNASLPEHIKHIIVAGVPDPTPLAVRILERLSERLQIDILVHAPEKHAQCFDEFGRPLEKFWQHVIINIPDEENIMLVSTQREQAQKVLELLQRDSDRFSPNEITIAVPDRSVVPFLEMTLADSGLSTFDPADRLLSETSLYRLLVSFLNVMMERSYSSVSTWLRHPDVLNYLQSSHHLSPDSVLAELDIIKKQHLPQSLGEMLSIMSNDRIEESYSNLKIALTSLQKQIDSFQDKPLQEWIPCFLQTIYASKIIKQHLPSDVELIEIAEVLYGVIKEFDNISQLISVTNSYQQGLLETLFIKRLGECLYHPQMPSDVASQSAFELQGWLELPWNSAPILIITGMNDEFVPGGQLEHLFLPDALRTKLKLRNDASRFARDAFVITTLIESRRSTGAIYFILSKNGIQGEVLKPSRLFFLCDDKLLIQRARRLFAQVNDESGNFAPTVSFMLNPNLVCEANQLSRKSVLHVTAFRDYLKCPFRFFLKHILRMEHVTDDVAWLDNAQVGALIHLVLEQIGYNEEIKKSENPDHIADFLEDVLQQKTRELYGNNPPLPVQLQIEALRWRLRASAEAHAEFVREGWEIIAVERIVTTQMLGVEIRGKIDRIDRHRDTGVLRIIDYKSADKSSNPKETHLANWTSNTPDFAKVQIGTENKRWIDLQLPLYIIMLQQTTFQNTNFQLCYFNLPRTLEDTGLAVWDNLDDKLLESARKCVEAVIQAIQEGKFWPPTELKEQDDFEYMFVTKPELCFVPPKIVK